MRFPLIFLLNRDYQVVATMSNELPESLPVIEDNYTRSLDDGTNEVYVKTILGHKNSTDIEEDMYIYYPVEPGVSKLFRIVEVEEDRGATPTISCRAELSAYGDLLDGVVRPTEFKSATIKEIVNHILLDTGWEYVEGDTYPQIDWKITDYKTKLEALTDLSKKINMEIDYNYIMNNNIRIERRVISFYKKVDNQVGTFVARGNNLTNIKRTIYSKEVVTSMIGVGPDIDGSPLTFATLKPGSFLPPGFEKPYGSDFVTNKEAVQIYGRERFGIYVNTDVKAQEELCVKTVEALKEAMKPKVKYEVDMVYITIKQGEYLSLGKKVYINDTTIEPRIALSARIRQMSTSIYNPVSNTVTLGDYITYDTSINDKIAQMQDKLNQAEKEWNKDIWDLEIVASNGFNFVNNEGQTTLTMVITKNGFPYDELGGAADYTWARFNEEGIQIPLSGVSGTTMEVKTKDLVILGANIKNKANFVGTVNLPEI